VHSSVVTRFQEDGITRFFVQNGTKIEAPASTWPDMPKSASISSEYCDAKANALMATSASERNLFKEIGGGAKLIETLKTPMVLVMSILDDVGISLSLLLSPSLSIAPQVVDWRSKLRLVAC
jgi:cellulose 1,4-beta-cellobiosidase